MLAMASRCTVPVATSRAAGLAVEGVKPFCCIYSTFLQRGYDQLVHDVVIQKLPVRFILDRAGLVGNDGPTHHGSFDLAYLGCIPGLVICAPSDEVELMHMVQTIYQCDNLPTALRFPRGSALGLDKLKPPDEFVCPITYEVMQDPVCASDGHTYERSAIEELLALPEPRRRSPLTRETLQASLYPNIALKKRIAAHEQEAEAVAERAAELAAVLPADRRPVVRGAVSTPDKTHPHTRPQQREREDHESGRDRYA